MSFQQAEVPEDSDDDDPDEVFGFITMLNLTERKVTCWAIKQRANREDNVVKVETTCHLGPVDACESNVKKCQSDEHSSVITTGNTEVKAVFLPNNTYYWPDHWFNSLWSSAERFKPARGVTEKEG